MTASPLTVSRLAKTWLIDVDGVCLVHNGHLAGDDRLLPGVKAFWAAHIGPDDVVVLLSARRPEWRKATLDLFAAHGLRVDHALFGLPPGERVLINDDKPSGLATAHAVRLTRDAGLAGLRVRVDPEL